MRLSTAVFGATCVALVLVVEKMDTTILQLSMSLGSVHNGPLLGIFTMGVMIPWVHGTGALVGGITGLISMAWHCYNAQTDIATGSLKIETKPLSTAECPYNFAGPSLVDLMTSNATVPFQAER
jgi:solute carrier family 5 (sodium-coupled monocarboxylate transporter), member 8/12